MTNRDDEQHEQIFQLNIFYYATGIPIAFIKTNNETELRLPDNEYLKPDLFRMNSLQNQALTAIKKMTNGRCAMFEDEYRQHYFCVGVNQEGESSASSAMLLAGPIQLLDITFKDLHELLLHHSLSISYHKMMKEHYELTPKLTTEQIKYIKLLLQNLDKFEYEAFDKDVTKSNTPLAPIIAISILETQPISHHPLEMERAFLGALKNKDRSILDKLAQFDQFPIPNIGNGDQIRAFKNVLISAVAVAIREMTVTGIDFKQLQHFSDRFINKVKETSQLSELTTMYHTLFDDLLNLIETYEKEKYSKSVNQALIYIRDYLSNSLTLEEISKHVGFNPRYFSKIFKQETGMTVFHFISKERIKVAKHLLTNTTETIIDIAHYAGFKNQSYFTQVFKKN